MVDGALTSAGGDEAGLRALLATSISPTEFDLVALKPVLPSMSRDQTRELGRGLEDSLRRRIVDVLRAQVARVTSHSTVQMRPRDRRVRRSGSRRGPPSNDDPHLGRRRLGTIATECGFAHIGDLVQTELERLRGARA